MHINTSPYSLHYSEQYSTLIHRGGGVEWSEGVHLKLSDFVPLFLTEDSDVLPCVKRHISTADMEVVGMMGNLRR